MKALAILLTIALIGGCISGKNPEEFTFVVSGNPTLLACNNKPTPVQRENCYLETAFEKSAPSLCDEISLESIRNLCFHRIAKTIMDSKACYGIKNDEWRFNDCIEKTNMNRP
jgi:hypothetical protein